MVYPIICSHNWKEGKGEGEGYFDRRSVPGITLFPIWHDGVPPLSQPLTDMVFCLTTDTEI